MIYQSKVAHSYSYYLLKLTVYIIGMNYADYIYICLNVAHCGMFICGPHLFPLCCQIRLCRQMFKGLIKCFPKAKITATQSFFAFTEDAELITLVVLLPNHHANILRKTWKLSFCAYQYHCNNKDS